MKNNHFIKYYRVYKNDTVVTEVFVNDFKPVLARRFKRGILINDAKEEREVIPCLEYSLLSGEGMFYGYLDKATAMEKAKAGALAHINQMTKDAELAINKLTQYRADHYDDLNVNLLDANIQRIKRQINIK